jgi:hypothetical protein
MRDLEPEFEENCSQCAGCAHCLASPRAHPCNVCTRCWVGQRQAEPSDMWEPKPVADQPAIKDPVNSPPHYNQFPIEVIQLTRHLNFNRGNAVKYTARAGHKDPEREVEDLKKARWYIDDEIQRLTGEGDHAKP